MIFFGNLNVLLSFIIVMFYLASLT